MSIAEFIVRRHRTDLMQRFAGGRFVFYARGYGQGLSVCKRL